MTETLPEVETEMLSREDAKKIAAECRDQPVPDSIDKIPPSLLSAEHIRLVVKKTGLISPFFLGGKKKRLKKASYEGRIGEKAYVFKDGKLIPATFNDDKLFIPANSIVFAESDLDFRLPEYIALRFNLHIEHVHRGLLLGTGPLVDPGYWGKLCIPLHNLTSEDYEISRDEGLIWIEFTKTTSDIDNAANAIGVAPNTTEYWDIDRFIKKAAKGVSGAVNVPIQSSIGGALLSASKAAQTAKNQTLWLSGVSIVGVIALIVAVATLTANMLSTIEGQVGLSQQFVGEAKAGLEAALETLDDQAAVISKQEAELKSLLAQVNVLNAAQGRILELEHKLNALSAALAEFQSNSQNPDIAR